MPLHTFDSHTDQTIYRQNSIELKGAFRSQLLKKIGILNLPEWYNAGLEAQKNSFAPFGKLSRLKSCRDLHLIGTKLVRSLAISPQLGRVPQGIDVVVGYMLIWRYSKVDHSKVQVFNLFNVVQVFFLQYSSSSLDLLRQRDTSISKSQEARQVHDWKIKFAPLSSPPHLSWIGQSCQRLHSIYIVLELHGVMQHCWSLSSYTSKWRRESQVASLDWRELWREKRTATPEVCLTHSTSLGTLFLSLSAYNLLKLTFPDLSCALATADCLDYIVQFSHALYMILEQLTIPTYKWTRYIADVHELKSARIVISTSLLWLKRHALRYMTNAHHEKSSQFFWLLAVVHHTRRTRPRRSRTAD